MTIWRRNTRSLARLCGALLLCASGALLGLGPAAATDALCADSPGNYAEAIAACTAAIADTEDVAGKARLLTQQAKLQRRSGDPEGAVASIDEATRLAPGDADAWIEKGYVEHDLQHLQAALEAHTRARDARPDYWRAVVVRLNSLADVGRYDECLQDAVRAVELAPERAHTYAYRGRCLYETGKLDAAIADYEQAARIGLEESFLHSNLALAYLDAGRNEDALVAAQHAVGLKATDELAQWSLVEALMLLGRHEEAVTAYETAQAAGLPDTIGRANQLAWLLYLAGDYATARPVMEAYFAADSELGPDQSYEADTFGHILAALGDKDKAIEMFQLALRLGGPEKADAYRKSLERLGIGVTGDDLESALRACVDLGAACRLGD